MKASAVIVAAGASTRFGENKVLAELCGRPVLAWSLAAFEAADSIDRIVIVGSLALFDDLRALGQKWAPLKFDRVVEGGARRRDSVEAGLRVNHSRYVVIHDGARPLVTSELIDRCVAAAHRHAGAIAATPMVDTIKEVRDGMIAGHPDRTRLWAAQTPQVVLRQAWLDAAVAGDGDETDDAAMLGRFDLDVAVVESTGENLKITRPLDLEVARLILERREQQ